MPGSMVCMGREIVIDNGKRNYEVRDLRAPRERCSNKRIIVKRRNGHQSNSTS